MATFWEIAAHSVDHMFSLYFDYQCSFEGWIWVLIASVPDLCIVFTFMIDKWFGMTDHKQIGGNSVIHKLCYT